MCVKVEIGDVVSEAAHRCLTGSITGRVGWAHVSGDVAEDIPKGHLVLDHFVTAGAFIKLQVYISLCSFIINSGRKRGLTVERSAWDQV